MSSRLIGGFSLIRCLDISLQSLYIALVLLFDLAVSLAVL